MTTTPESVMPPVQPSLRALTRRSLASHAPARLLVAYSGGRDSSVLLHVLASLPAARSRGVRAVHVDHGLHPDATAWVEHCRRFCATLDVPLVVVKVSASNVDGLGPEAAARKARYQAFSDTLRNDEWLLLAQHRDDQAETVLLKLLRGAGPEGLAGMRPLRRFAHGWLWRPWLDVPREALRDYAAAQALDCIDDPANHDPRMARSFLRSDILPRLHQHWPKVEATLAHTATLCRQAADYIDADADAALQRLRAGDAASLDASAWLALDDALRTPVLQRWLHQQQLPAPTTGQRRQLERQIREAASDRVPRVDWPGAEVRMWRNRLYAMPRRTAIPECWRAAWDGSRLALPDGGALSLSPASMRIEPSLEVRLREGGERLRPATKPHTRDLRDLLQMANLPPWLRDRCPLLYQQGKLIGIADLYVSDAGEALFSQIGAQPCWQRAGDTSAAERLD